MTERVVNLKVELSEGSWHLLLSSDFADYDFVLPAVVAIDLAEQGTKELRQWSESASRVGERYAELDDAYSLDDPKHPDYLAGADLARDIERGK